MTIQTLNVIIIKFTKYCALVFWNINNKGKISLCQILS